MTSKKRTRFLAPFAYILLISLLLSFTHSPVLAALPDQAAAGGSPAAAEEGNACLPDISSLAVYWPLDEDAGATSFDDAIGIREATCSSGTCPAKASGKINGAFSFDGADKVTAANTADLQWNGTQNFSLEVWVKLSDASCTGREVFYGKYAGNDLGPDQPDMTAWWVGCEAGTKEALFNLRSSTYHESEPNERVLVIGPALTANAWHHIVAVRDGTNDLAQLYVDGVPGTPVAYNPQGNFVSDAPVTIGWYDTPDNFYYFNGFLDEIAIYNGALSANQVSAHYNAGQGQSYCNDKPAAIDDASEALTTDEDTPLVINASVLLGNDIDIDPPPEALSISAVDALSSRGGSLTGLGPVTYDPAENINGTDTFTYTVSDSKGATDTAVVTVAITRVNDPPVVTSPGQQTSLEGADIDLTISASDPDALDEAPHTGVLSFQAENLPPGLSIDASTGKIKGTISYAAARPTPYEVKVTATDNNAPTPASGFAEFDWTVGDVNQPPSVTNPGEQTSAEGADIALQIVATEPDGQSLTYSATGLPAGLSIGPTNGKITGKISYEAFTPASGGLYHVEVTVSDNFIPAASTTIQFDWTVTNTNRAPEVTNPGAKSSVPGEKVSFQIQASDPDGDKNLTFSVDSTKKLPPGLNIHPTSGLISGTILPAGDAIKTYIVRVTVSDGDQSTAIEFTWAVGKFNVFLPSVVTGFRP